MNISQDTRVFFSFYDVTIINKDINEQWLISLQEFDIES